MTAATVDREMLREMLAKAERKLVSAGTMLDTGHYDDAASRAYYAAFHALGAVLGARSPRVAPGRG